MCQRKRHHNMWYVGIYFYKPRYSVILRSKKNKLYLENFFWTNKCRKQLYDIEDQPNKIMKSIPTNISNVPSPRYRISASFNIYQLRRTLNRILLLLTATIYTAVEMEIARPWKLMWIISKLPNHIPFEEFCKIICQ